MGLWWVALALLAAEVTSPGDQREIESRIDSLNEPEVEASAFSHGSVPETELRKLIGIHEADSMPRPRLIGMQEPWSLMTTPKISAGRVRLLTMQNAVVDGTSRIDGAVVLRRSVPLRFVLRREEGVWRIVSIEVLGQ